LPGTPALRREQIKLQAALITPLLHVKGYASPESKAAAERGRLLIEQAEALGEPPDDPLPLFSVLYGVWVANLVAFNGAAMLELAAQFLALAKAGPMPRTGRSAARACPESSPVIKARNMCLIGLSNSHSPELKLQVRHECSGLSAR
jgi:hypothetical protein